MLLSAVACLTAPAVLANEISDQFLVTASRTVQSLGETMAQAIIVSREEIAAAGPVSLVELLQRRAGVEIRATGGPGQPSSVFIRGANGTHTLVLIDGQRVSSSTSGATALENIPLELIDRIEIVKGPRSGYYGSDAIGGVIQIFTRRGQTSGGYISLAAGNNSSQSADVGMTAVMGASTVTLAAGHQKIDAPSVTNPLAGPYTYHADRDPYKNAYGKIALSHRFSVSDQLRLNLWNSKGKTNFDSGPGLPEAVNNQTLTGVALQSDNQLMVDWNSRLSMGQTIDDSHIESAYGGQFKTEQAHFSWLNEVKFAGADLTAGLERRQEEVSGTTVYTNATRTTDALLMAASQKIASLSWSANLRHDREQQFGTRSTGGLTLGYQMTPAHFWYASAASGFRAPSFNDLYYPGFSNSFLQPEKSRSQEIGWRMRNSDVRLNLAVFDNKIENLIAFDFMTFKPQNITSARIRGVEFDLEATLAGINWRLQMTAQSPKDVSTDKQLRSRAKIYGAIGASKNVGAWQWQVDAVAGGLRFDSADESSSARLGGYTLLNASLRFAIDRQWQIALTGTNLADRVFELARGYNQSGRQLILQVKFNVNSDRK